MKWSTMQFLCTMHVHMIWITMISSIMKNLLYDNKWQKFCLAFRKCLKNWYAFWHVGTLRWKIFMPYGTLASKNENLPRFWHISTQACWHINHADTEARWYINHASTQACWHVYHVGTQARLARNLGNSVKDGAWICCYCHKLFVLSSLSKDFFTIQRTADFWNMLRYERPPQQIEFII